MDRYQEAWNRIIVAAVVGIVCLCGCGGAPGGAPGGSGAGNGGGNNNGGGGGGSSDSSSDRITLSARGVSLPGSGPATYAWRQTAGPSVSLTQADTASPSFVPPQTQGASSFQFEVTISSEGQMLRFNLSAVSNRSTDPQGRPVSNAPPKADAGAAQIVEAGHEVTLSAANSTDLDSTNLTFQWRQVAVVDADASGAVALDNDRSPSASFTPNAAGDFYFLVEVSDGVSTSTAITAVHVIPPVLSPILETVISTFDVDDDGWRVQGGSFNGLAVPAHSASDGGDGGHAYASSDGSWYWVAPTKFRGNASGAYGTTLSFSVNQEFQCGGYGSPLVILEGGGLALNYSIPYLARETWTGFSVRFAESAHWTNAETGLQATAIELRAALASVTQIKILGTFSTCGGAQTGGLDTVVLRIGDSKPAPLGAFVASSFDEDADGWTVAGGTFDRAGPLRFVASGGSPDGHLEAEGDQDWYWQAPATYKGDASGWAGKSLTFDVDQSFVCGGTTSPLVIIDGGGHELVYAVPFGAGETWTSYQVRFSADEYWRNMETEKYATTQELLEALSDVQELKILGWHETCGGAGAGGIDNVVAGMDAAELPELTGVLAETFDHDAAGWTVAGGGFGLSGPVRYASTEGNPGGAVFAEGNDAWYWQAPPGFRGDGKAMYRGSLSFDLYQSFTCGQTGAPMVVLEGGGDALTCAIDHAAGDGWTSYGVSLDETELWFSKTTGQRATATVVEHVLESLSQVKILGWHESCGGAGVGGLDNVVMRSGT